MYYRQVCLDNKYKIKTGGRGAENKKKVGPGKAVRLRNLHIKKIFDMM